MPFLMRFLCSVILVVSGPVLSDQSDVLPAVDVVSSRLPQVDRVPVSIERRLERIDIERRHFMSIANESFPLANAELTT